MKILILTLIVLTMFVCLVSAEDVQCNDLKDNDLDGTTDYLGACQKTDGVIASCFDFGIIIPSQCLTYCVNDLRGVYISPDMYCSSIRDDSESSVVTSTTSSTPSVGSSLISRSSSTKSSIKMGAPEEDQSFLSRFWKFLFYVS